MIDVLYNLPEAEVDPDLCCSYCSKPGAVANTLHSSREDGVLSVPTAFCPMCSVLLGFGTLPGVPDPAEGLQLARSVALHRIIEAGAVSGG